MNYADLISLGVHSEATWRRLVKCKVLKPHRPGYRTAWFKVSDVERYLGVVLTFNGTAWTMRPAEGWQKLV